MLKCLITISLLVSFGVLPATAHAYNLASLVCQTLEQDEESCCTAEGECKLTMPQMSHCQVQTNSQNECLCAINAAKHPDGIIASAPLLPSLDDPLKIFLPTVLGSENTRTALSLRSTPHHKSNKTYLKNTCLRL